MHIRYRIAAAALAVVLALFLGLPALADTGYTGEIDPETGQPYDSDTAAENTGRTVLSDSMYYDWSTHDYVYPVAAGLGEVHSDAADGMVLTRPVYIEPGEAAVEVYLNGSPYSGKLSSCAAVGEYVVSAQVNGQTRRLLGFTLVNGVTSALHSFVVPDGFYILTAERDGQNVYYDRYSVDMEDEGTYVIEYECIGTDLVYKLETTVDRTPPSLSFQGRADAQGRIRSQLDFTGLQSGDSLYLANSGTAVEPELNGDGTGTVYDPGNYVMIVTDAAGNSVEYAFIILQYFNLQSWIFFLIVIACAAAVVVYIIVKRKRLKIG